MKKTVLISINGLYELNGGGIYLRTIVDKLAREYDSLVCLSKEINCVEENIVISGKLRTIFFKKTTFIDLVSRLLFVPSFLGFYIIKIFKIVGCVKPDVIAFHNSRIAILALVLKLYYRKEIVYFFDNCELKLSFVNFKSAGVKSIVSIIDFFLLSISERIALRIADRKICITKSDMEELGILEAEILPVKLPKRHLPVFNENTSFTVLFTGAFGFFPNQTAFYDLLEVALQTPDVRYIVAGSSAKSISGALGGIENVTVIDSPSSLEMEKLFERSQLYYSPVKIGSGMKTKLVEALSFGLPVVATKHSAIGYERVLDSDCFILVESIAQSVQAIKKMQCILTINTDEYYRYRIKAFQLFEEYYSY